MRQEGIILNIIDYLDENLTEEISIDNIAGKFHFNRFYLMKMFKKITGITILEYVNQRKIKSSLNDVATTDDKILKIALTHGFNSLEYYSETFYKIVGISPTQFRRTVLINPDILLGGDEEDMNRLEKVQSDIKLLSDLRQSLLTNERDIPITIEPLVTKKEKPKVYELKRREENSFYKNVA
jgi:AraC-type DNA-binding domain-containing proteins